jgi:hypothetical protein
MYGGGGGAGGAYGAPAAFANRNQRGEHRPLDVSAGLLAFLDRRIVDGTALGPNARTRRTAALAPHPAWRRQGTTPRYTLSPTDHTYKQRRLHYYLQGLSVLLERLWASPRPVASESLAGFVTFTVYD